MACILTDKVKMEDAQISSVEIKDSWSLNWFI